jgi:predicted deacylase
MSSALPCGRPFDHVEDGDVAQFLHAGQQGQGATDIAAADEGDFLARHREILRNCTCLGVGIGRPKG